MQPCHRLSVSQADNEGSIPFTRSTNQGLQRCKYVTAISWGPYWGPFVCLQAQTADGPRPTPP